MRVKLCSRCPYTPRDLAGHYDPEGILHACAMCDSRQQNKASADQPLRKAQRRQKCATVSSILPMAQPSVARSVTESSALSGTTPGAPHFAQGNALNSSRPVGTPTKDGYADFETPPDNGYNGEHHDAISRRSGFRSKETVQ
jgi:hypothetical protein